MVIDIYCWFCCRGGVVFSIQKTLTERPWLVGIGVSKPAYETIVLKEDIKLAQNGEEIGALHKGAKLKSKFYVDKMTHYEMNVLFELSEVDSDVFEGGNTKNVEVLYAILPDL